MSLSSVLVEEALEEFLEATRYLEDRSEGLGEKFNLAFAEAVEMILAFPEIGSPMKRHQVRRFNLRGFSYHLIYRIEEDAIVIYAVAHHKRRPGYWSGRLN
jgi:toxin ParE1/3/4